MPTAEEDRDNERATRGVAPGALSALLEELAQAPAPGGEEEERILQGPRPGTIIGRFELQGEIGRGGFGVVYVARDRELRRLVAFKLVRPGRLEKGEDQLRREAEVIAQLAHPNLVTLFDVGRCEHGPYLVLELLRGETLEQRLHREPVAPAEAVRIAAEVAEGLRYAHAQGVVHRDLKPSNVFLTQAGPVKLLDFGMSHAFGWRRVEGGTPSYMAPEQLHGAPEDERTDVYALGVMLYRMLAGELPFPRDARALRGDRTPPRLEVPGEPELGALVGRMLAPEPTGRPRDAAEVATALGQLRQTLSQAPVPLGPVRTRRPRRRGLLVAALLSALVAAAALAWALRPTPPPPPRTIAVLPFQNRSDSPDAEYFSDGVADEVRDRLTRLQELKVAPASASFHFKRRSVELPEIAQRLRVEVVLDGTVQKERDRLRISAELVDARSGFRIWSRIYEQRLEDVFAIQDDIARQVAGALAIVTTGTTEDRLRRARPADLAIYDRYLRARALLRLPSSDETLDQATALLDEAVRADDHFTQGYAALCDAWLARYLSRRAAESFARAEEACGRALALDAQSSEVYLALGNLHLASGRYADAEGEFRRAGALTPRAADALLGLARAQMARKNLPAAERTLEEARSVDPGYWRVYQQRAVMLLRSGRPAEAAAQYAEVIARAPDSASAYSDLGAAHFLDGDPEKAARAWEKAQRISPTAEGLSNTGTGYYFLGRFEDAARMFRGAVELAPADHRWRVHLGDALAQVPGGAAEAAAAWREAARLGEARLAINPTDAAARADVARCQAELGEAMRARALRDEALRTSPDDGRVRFRAAQVDVRLGEREQALEELERAVALGYQRRLLPLDPTLAPLRGEPRFQALMAPQAK